MELIEQPSPEGIYKPIAEDYFFLSVEHRAGGLGAVSILAQILNTYFLPPFSMPWIQQAIAKLYKSISDSMSHQIQLTKSIYVGIIFLAVKQKLFPLPYFSLTYLYEIMSIPPEPQAGS